jgi:hypothetical protein
MIGTCRASEIIRQVRVRAAGRVVDRAARINVVTLKRIVMLGMLLRVMLLMMTSGSYDIFTWENFGRSIAQGGCSTSIGGQPGSPRGCLRRNRVSTTRR